MSWVAGLDGAPGGWAAILHSPETGEVRLTTLSKWTEILSRNEDPDVIGIDIPIGLLDRAEHGGRKCDQEARQLLGPIRASSVFSPPAFSALQAQSYPEALQLNRASSALQIGISRQCYGLFAKLVEVHGTITPVLQKRVFEIHPELSFLALAGRPMRASKKSWEGVQERRDNLKIFAAAVESFIKNPLPGVAIDDLLDACAACWTAGRIRAGVAVRIPAEVVLDSRGLRMEMLR